MATDFERNPPPLTSLWLGGIWKSLICTGDPVVVMDTKTPGNKYLKAAFYDLILLEIKNLGSQI